MGRLQRLLPGSARLRSVLEQPVHWPKPTTRRMMGLVAAVALLLWGVLRGPDILDELEDRREKAEQYEFMEVQFRQQYRKRLAAAQGMKAELERWRREIAQPDDRTERYLVSRYERQALSGKYAAALADYYAGLKQKYCEARWHPWETLTRKPAPPPAPEPPGPPGLTFKRVPGKSYQWITEGRGSSLAFSPNSAMLAVGTSDNTIKLFDTASGALMADLPVPDGPPLKLQFAPDGTSLIALVGLRAQNVRRWDIAMRQAVGDLRWNDATPRASGSSGSISALAYAPDGRSIAIGADRPARDPAKPAFAVSLFDVAIGRRLWDRTMSDWVSCLAFTRDGEALACASGGVVTLLDASTGTPRAMLKPATGYVATVTLAPDGRTAAGAGSDAKPASGTFGKGQFTLWDIRDGTVLRTFDGPAGHAQPVVFSPDGRRIAAAGRGPTRPGRITHDTIDEMRPSEVRVWDRLTGALVWRADGETQDIGVVHLAWAPDGRTIAFIDSDRCYLLNAKDGRVQRMLLETTTTLQVRDRRR